MSDAAASAPTAPAHDAFAPLLARLQEQHGFARVGAGEGEDPLAAVDADSVLLLTEPPQRSPESWDLAVVLPEVLKGFAGRLAAGVADPSASAGIAARYGVARFPALLFRRGGQYVGVLEGMRDWAAFAPAIAAMLAAPVSRAPGIGIAVRGGASSSCH